jgi:hypothetical protein
MQYAEVWSQLRGSSLQANMYRSTLNTKLSPENGTISERPLTSPPIDGHPNCTVSSIPLVRKSFKAQAIALRFGLAMHHAYEMISLSYVSAWLA